MMSHQCNGFGMKVLWSGSRSEASPHPFSVERRFTGGASAAPNSFRSPSSLSESSPWASTSKQPESLPQRTFSSLRSFLSKPVYPLIYQNPVSDGEAFGSVESSCVNRLATPESRNSSHWPSSSSHTLEHKFQKTLNQLQTMDASPDHSMSSRREGFRWSNASSYDLGFDGESFDVAEHVELENPRSPNHTAHQKCVLCGRLLSQKSPWSSYCMVRGGDMPIAGVLFCSHVFHAECLEQATPKAQVSEPPCPICLKNVGVIEESESFSEPLQMALRTIRRNRGVVISDNVENNESDRYVDPTESTGFRRNQSLTGSKQNGSSSSLIKSHLKKHLSFKGKSGKDFFGTKSIFRKIGSSSSSQDHVGCGRPTKSWKK
ncbi:hypothetical protein C5167_003316 [Papaver somniferum]|uniref:RING-type domain-containing protein n=1 Tax=Papaver somniferum TaxID=3469 RepID=A0A4Y7L399_PAPSO|nr:hypothetical protein C5167_003316 [Papaver somniferum]